MPTRNPSIIASRAVVLATGGIGHLYAVTTNPAEASGLGLAIAARAGAVIADPEFVQFHPTAIMVGRDPAPLATEALRGEGATLINDRGERFMLALHPLAELAPRDIVARGVFAEIAAGRGAFLDATTALGAHFAEKFPTVYASCIAAGIDPAKQPIPVAPAAHYHMGGIAVDTHGRTSLKGLWAGGEVSSHRRAWRQPAGVEFAARGRGLCRAHRRGYRGPARSRRLPACRRRRSTQRNSAMPPLAEAKLRAMMTSHVGVIRDGEQLAEAVRTFAAIERDSRQYRAAQHGNHGAVGGGVGLGAARKPRRALPHRLSGREAGAGASHHDDAGSGAGYRGIARRPRAGAVTATVIA